MSPVRCLRRALRRLVDQCGGATLLALLLMTAIGAWALLSGWRAPEPGTWTHAALSFGLVTLALVTAVQSRRERKRYERLKRDACRRNAIAAARSRAMRAEAERLLPQARAGYA
jgi:hypothetical protein